jgi:hypothetical protein
VLQPTHASSRVGGLPSDAHGAPFSWREPFEEIKAILDGYNAACQPGTFNHTVLDDCMTEGVTPAKSH